MMRLVTFLILFLLISPSFVFADQVFFKNGDRLSGKITFRNDKSITVVSPALGTAVIKMSLVDHVEIDAAPAVVSKEAKTMAKRLWKNTLSMGYVVSSGNTDSSRATIGLDSSFKKEKTEVSLKAKWSYAEENDQMTEQKFFAKAQSDHYFRENGHWFLRRAIEVSHDYFNNVDYRLIPTLGPGYKFWDHKDSKALVDLSVGYEYTNYRDSTKSEGVWILVPHGYWDQRLFDGFKLSEELTYYPSLEDPADFRLRSETALTHPLTNKLSWKLAYLDEFNSAPEGGAKKNDATFRMSLEYAF